MTSVLHALKIVFYYFVAYIGVCVLTYGVTHSILEAMRRNNQLTNERDPNESKKKPTQAD